MTAYELADAIEDWDSDGQWDTPAANMLRQQADELTEAGGMIGVLREQVSQQADRIAHLEMLVANRNDIIDKLDLEPQTKPLNDEEIYALWCEADNTELLPEMRLKDGSINYIITTFAKLIEEKHGIEPTDRIG